MLKGILHFSHQLLEDTVTKGETVIDATCGNGCDTLYISKLVGEHGHVLAFDVQEQAIKNTELLLKENTRKNVTLIHDSHTQILDYLREDTIGGAIFNLGYLPKSDKSIITKGQTTISAVNIILNLLKKGGLIVIVVYHGHEGGRSEKEAILEHVTSLDQKQCNVLRYEFINQKNEPPFILAIQKK
ncbi:class I SAM-dependent methyltransferase [Virgibacillus byunsanensis]|uniref:Class I SAM-dependent methyltransferase n=1 Tax=Virgibacillus byunsanensis TaxID=570945 RepID=A0ABW3LQ62_9BACI